MSTKSSFISFKKKNKTKKIKVKPTKSLFASLTKKKDSIFSKLGIKSLVNQFSDDMIIKSNVIEENRKFLKTLNKEQLNVLSLYKIWFGQENNLLRNNFDLSEYKSQFLNMSKSDILHFETLNKDKYYFDIHKENNKLDYHLKMFYEKINNFLNHIKIMFVIFKKKNIPKLKEDITLYRGAHIYNIDTLKVGDTIDYNEVNSFSYNKSIAQSFANNDIIILKNTKGLPYFLLEWDITNYHDEKHMKQSYNNLYPKVFGDEREFILSPGLKIRIDKIQRNLNNKKLKEMGFIKYNRVKDFNTLNMYLQSIGLTYSEIKKNNLEQKIYNSQKFKNFLKDNQKSFLFNVIECSVVDCDINRIKIPKNTKELFNNSDLINIRINANFITHVIKHLEKQEKNKKITDAKKQSKKQSKKEIKK